ncbi:Phage portal protein [Chryseobacterium oranimense]|uniref:Phage portal protein n=1 Tax=Chryseobacterium oranimense TaxID=421058 RepID=A0A1M5X8D2_9FLAO|nr:phage portal protein [Chryseobacterium oranimense]SHH96059.1 Phage portal protein [Chryseobacterium oranimense]
MNVFTKIGNVVDTIKHAWDGDYLPYTRLDDGTHAYNYGTSRIDEFLDVVGIKKAYYTPVENLKYYYHNVFFLADCIDLYAETCSQVNIIEIDKNGNEIENSKYVEFLNNPNPFQTLPEFITEMVINTLTTGISIQSGNYFKNGNLKIGSQLYNIDFNRLSMPAIKNPYIVTGKGLQDLDVKERLDGREVRPLKMFELAYFYDRLPQKGFDISSYNPKNYFNPTSRIFPLISSLQTLINSQDTMCYLTNSPVNSVLSPDHGNTSAGGYRPLEGDQKRDAEFKLSGKGPYGAGRGKIGDTIVTNESLKHLDLSRNNAKAQNIEMQDNAKSNIRTRFSIPKDYFFDSTYENKQVSEARFTLGPVKAITDKWLNTLVQKSPEYFNNGNALIGKYDHLPSVIAGKSAEENASALDRAKTTNEVIKAYKEFKLIDPEITWDDFLIAHQFNGFYKVK